MAFCLDKLNFPESLMGSVLDSLNYFHISIG